MKPNKLLKYKTARGTYNTHVRVMSKVIYIIGILLVVFSISMFIYQTWVLNNPPNSDVEYYLKPVISNSFSWLNYQLHALLLGLAFLAVNKFTNLFSG